jgi:hypothetical protein
MDFKVFGSTASVSAGLIVGIFCSSPLSSERRSDLLTGSLVFLESLGVFVPLAAVFATGNSFFSSRCRVNTLFFTAGVSVLDERECKRAEKLPESDFDVEDFDSTASDNGDAIFFICVVIIICSKYLYM